MDNKATGSFYTPDRLINYMISYIQQRMMPKTILEPSAGDGRFVEALKRFEATITLVELERMKADALTSKFSNTCSVYCNDFIRYSLDNETKYELIIGNPPYISKKLLTQDQRKVAVEIIEYYGLPQTLFQNIWVSFILAAMKLVEKKGAIFFVLPFEFLQVQYAERLRGFLEERFNTIEITTFEDRVFCDIEQDVCLVYLSNENEENPFIRYTTIISDSDPRETFQSVIKRNKPLKKWSNCILDDTETEKLLDIARRYPEIQSFGEISPGIVTGANSFFIVDQAQRDSLDMDPKVYLPILSKCSAMKSLLAFKQDDFLELANKGQPVYLINLQSVLEKEFSYELIEYLQDGIRKNINERYKCSIRGRWHDVPVVKSGDISFFKRFSSMPRLIINNINVHTTDIAYNVRLKKDFDKNAFAFCFFNSLTLALCEYNGRFYGGGVGELVPSEFKKLRLPYKQITSNEVEHLDQMMRSNTSIDHIVDYVDSIVLDLEPDDIGALRLMRHKYLQRRMKLYERKSKDNGE